MRMKLVSIAELIATKRSRHGPSRCPARSRTSETQSLLAADLSVFGAVVDLRLVNAVGVDLRGEAAQGAFLAA